MDTKQSVQSCNVFNFDSLKSIHQSVQYSVYGYVRGCQLLFPSNNSYYNIPELISCIILFYYDHPECFEINNSTIFNYISAKHFYCFHIFGTRRIERKYINQYKWKIKTSESYEGTLGIMDDTKNQTKSVHDKHSLWNRWKPYTAFAGTVRGGWSGDMFGRNRKVMSCFIEAGDTITIHLNYTTDKISFASLKSDKTKGNKTIVENLKEDIECVRSCRVWLCRLHHRDNSIKHIH
eukprot:UN05041